MDDDRDHEQMDTNGYGHHPTLEKQLEKRFLAAALRYCRHLDSGDHASCGDTCNFHDWMTTAHDLLKKI